MQYEKRSHIIYESYKRRQGGRQAMKQVMIEITVETGFAGCNHDDVLTITVPDNATSEEIAEQAEEEAKVYFQNCCSYGFHYVESCETCGGDDTPTVWRDRFSAAMCDDCYNKSILSASE